MPGPWRAARPARCSADAREQDTFTSPDIPRPASRRGSRDSPESMTSRTPGTVREDSASDVDTMIRGLPPGSRPETARSCSAGPIWPCSSRTSARAPAAQPGRHVGHLPGARDEHQGVNVPAGRQRFGVRRGGRVRHMVQEGPGHSALIQPRHRRGGPVHVQRIQRGRTVDDGRRAAAVVVPGVAARLRSGRRSGARPGWRTWRRA